jgi:hypothetical protein
MEAVNKHIEELEKWFAGGCRPQYWAQPPEKEKIWITNFSGGGAAAVGARDAVRVQVKVVEEEQARAGEEAAGTNPAPARAATAFVPNAGTGNSISSVSVALTEPVPSVEQRWRASDNKGEYEMGSKGKQIVGLDVAELLAELNRLYADEWLAAYAYNYMGQVVTGRPAAKQLAALLLDTSKDELEHQQELAERIEVSRSSAANCLAAGRPVTTWPI